MGKNIHRVTKKGKPGYQYGEDGDIFLYKPKNKESRIEAKQKAFKQSARAKKKTARVRKDKRREKK